MVKTIRAFFLSLTILAFLLFSTIGTTTVYADDGTGTETSETDTATSSEEEQASEPVTTEEETATGDDEPPVSSETEDLPPTEGEAQAGEDTEAEVPLETILEQVPENTTVTVLNSEGEALPLATQESADAIATDYDPIWCPTGQVPTPGENGCTQSFASFTELLTFLQTNEVDVAYQQAGTIYIQQGDYLGGESEIDFNDYAFNQINNYDLTLQGGWDTAYVPADGDPTYTTTNFNVPIIIGSGTNPWIGSLTVNNISIDGVSDQTGLTLETTGAITLENVEVTNSQAGIDITAGEEVSVKNVNASNNETYGAHIRGDKVAIDTGNFSNNGSGSDNNPTGSGLEVNSVNDVALIFVTANNNQLFGANITSNNVVAVEHSFFSGNFASSYDSEDDGYGLRVVTIADIAIDDVTADNNYRYGAYLEGNDITVESTTENNSSFTANGSGDITDPRGYGLKIVGTGTVEVIKVTANDNQFFGVDIEAGQEVTVLNSFFSGNQGVTNVWTLDAIFDGYGLKVVTQDDIFLNNVTGNFNNLWGANLIGNNVTVYNSQFNNNVSDTEIFIDDTGLFVDAAGLVDIWRVEAKENRLFGASIVSDGDVFVAESFFTGNQGITCWDFSCSEDLLTYHGIGLQVTTPGSIVVTDTDVSDNRLAGAELNEGVVTIANSIFNNNDMGNGLTINSGYDISLTAITASNNAGNGVEVNGVYCNQVVQVTGGTFSDNELYGFQVLNATLNLDGTQTFSNNGSGNVFTDTGTCIVVVATNDAGTNEPVTNETGNNEIVTNETDTNGQTDIPESTGSNEETEEMIIPVTSSSLTYIQSTNLTTTSTLESQSSTPAISTTSSYVFKPSISRTIKKMDHKGMASITSVWVMRFRHATN